MKTTIFTYGWKYTRRQLPADITIDCCELPNPYRVYPTMPGTEPEVRRFVLNNSTARILVAQTISLTVDLLNAQEEVTIGCFCHGGRHRSVAVAETLSKIFSLMHLQTHVSHLSIGEGRR